MEQPLIIFYMLFRFKLVRVEGFEPSLPRPERGGLPSYPIPCYSIMITRLYDVSPSKSISSHPSSVNQCINFLPHIC